MKKGLKAVIAILLALTLTVPLAACKGNPEPVAKESYNVTFHLNYGDAETYVVKVKAGTRTSSYKASRAGYTLKGWYKEPDCQNVFIFTEKINADIDLYALWERDADKVTVTFDFNYEGAREPAVVSLDSGKPIDESEIPTCPVLGKKYDGWEKQDVTWSIST